MSKGGAEAVPTRSQMQALPYLSALRPSTVLGHTVARATSQMPMPHEGGQGEHTLASYLEALTALPLEAEGDALLLPGAQTPRASALPSIRAAYSDSWRSLPAEVAAWQCVQASLDILVQRTAVADGASKVTMRAWYDSLLEIGTFFFR